MMNITTIPNNNGTMTSTSMVRSRGMSRREDSKTSRMTVPALPMPVAIFLCVLNCLVPGLGTFLSGFCMCCCGNKRDLTSSDLMACGCIQVLIAFGQLICTPFFLMGWIWSIIWGIAFIGQSADFYHNDPGREDNNPSRIPQRSFSMTFRLGGIHRAGPAVAPIQPPPYQETNPYPSAPTAPPIYCGPPPSYESVTQTQTQEQTRLPTLSGTLPGEPQMEVCSEPPSAYSHPCD